MAKLSSGSRPWGCRVHSLARTPVSLHLFMATGQRAGRRGGAGRRKGSVRRVRRMMANGVSRR